MSSDAASLLASRADLAAAASRGGGTCDGAFLATRVVGGWGAVWPRSTPHLPLRVPICRHGVFTASARAGAHLRARAHAPAWHAPRCRLPHSRMGFLLVRAGDCEFTAMCDCFSYAKQVAAEAAAQRVRSGRRTHDTGVLRVQGGASRCLARRQFPFFLRHSCTENAPFCVCVQTRPTMMVHGGIFLVFMPGGRHAGTGSLINSGGR